MSTRRRKPVYLPVARLRASLPADRHLPSRWNAAGGENLHGSKGNKRPVQEEGEHSTTLAHICSILPGVPPRLLPASRLLTASDRH